MCAAPALPYLNDMRGARITAAWRIGLGLLAAGLVVLSLWQLRTAHGGTVQAKVTLAGSPATVYRPPDAKREAPLVVVAHGFAGSRRMMQSLSLTLARSGFLVVAFDFIGHGRENRLLSPDVARIEGTTAQLVRQTQAVIEAARGLDGAAAGPVALLGHSMATDVVIRAARGVPDTAAIVAISMYSDAVTARFPERLLIVSGAWEGRLRKVGLRLLHQVDPALGEGETARAEGVLRRAIAAPRTEHVGVLYSPVTLAAARDWIAQAMGRAPGGPVAAIGWPVLGLLAGLVLAFPALLHAVPGAAAPPASGPVPARGRFLAALALPVLPAATAMLALAGQGPVAGMVPLAAFLGVWGAVQLAVLRGAGWRPGRAHWPALGLLLVWGLVFALALDRAGSAFVPAGIRAPLMLLLLIGALPFALADTALAQGAPPWRRVVSRLVVLGALGGTMMAAPGTLGLIFTVLPVLVLFWLVYGSFGRWTAMRAGATTAGLGSAVALAWALAASTPLFALP